MDKQVDKAHYGFSRYSHVDRWVSYFHQLDEILRLSPASLLEIGVGDKVLGSYIRNNTRISYTSVDMADDLHPDIVGSVTDLPLPDASYDVVVAFEVLEHLPYEQFTRALREMLRVSRGHVIISVPHFGPRLELFLKLPFVPELRLFYKIPYPKQHLFDGEHYWEVGKRGYPLSKIKKDISSVAEIQKDFIPFESPYHHFFVLQKI